MYLLDTNILSEVLRKSPSPQLLKRLSVAENAAKATSCICVMELRHGALRRDDGGNLWRRIEKELLGRLEILEVGLEEALLAGELLAGLSSTGQKIDVEDVLIAATALTHGFTVVTNNVRHFERIPGLRVEDWL